MNANTPENLHARAAKLAHVAGSAAIAQSHLAAANTSSVAARSDLSLIGDIKTAFDAIDRVIKRAEIQRKRLLRKADRLSQAAPK